jgi:RNA polymerase sigma-70 factor (ECF subfamily)
VAAFEAFVREYQHLVFGTAVRLLGQAAEAEDVSQTVFLRAFERFDELQSSPTVAGWLKTVTTNLCLNHLTRYRARWQFFSELQPDVEGRPFEESVEDTGEAPDDVLDADALARRQARLERALQELPDHQRVPIVLFHFDEQSYQDIAKTLGVSLSKVKTDIFRGRAALRRALEGQ